MNFRLIKQPKTILLFALAVALLGSISYGGYRYWQSRQVVPEPQEPPTVEELKPTPVTEPTADSNWNLYTNKEYGFSVEYPAGWGVAEKDISEKRDSLQVARDRIGFDLENVGYISVYVFESPPEESLEEWINQNKVLMKLSSLANVPNYPQSQVGGSPTFVVYSPRDSQVPDAVTAAFKKENYIFKIGHGRLGASVGESLGWNIYEHFLRTLEFEGTKGIPDRLPEFPMGF